MLDDIKPGDYAIIALGHNDATKSKPQRYCNKEDYTKNMTLFIDGIREKGATPILATSIIHIGGVSEDGDGKVSVRADAASLGPYLAATRELAAAKDVPLLDINAAAKDAFLKMTKKEIESHYMVLGPAESWYALKGTPALNLSQHQSLFQRVRTLHQMAKVLELQLQHFGSLHSPGP